MILLMCVIITLVHNPVEAWSVLGFTHINQNWNQFWFQNMDKAAAFVAVFWELPKVSYPCVNLEQYL